MYLEHFGLQRQPFKITPDTSLFYKGNKRGAALEALKYAIESGEGIVKVIGEVGSGKTMLCRMLEQELPDYIEIVYIANPSLSPENILPLIAFELQLPVAPDASKLELMQKLQHYLLQKHGENRQVLVLVEEAQSMPLETLEEIRLLSNLETAEHKLLQMVLFGQPELDEKLQQKDIRQLKERITHSFYLDPFTQDDIYQYLNYRMHAVGYRGPDIFSSAVIGSIQKESHGLTRRINILADKALLAVYAEGGHQLSKKHIHVAAQDSEFSDKKNNRNKGLMVTAVISLMLLSVWLGMQIGSRNSVAKTPLQTEVITPISHQPAVATQQPSLEQKIIQTKKWLANIDDGRITIQLMLLDEKGARSFLKNLPATLDMAKLHIYDMRMNNKKLYSVIYGNFDNKKEAQAVLSKFDEKLKKKKAYLRSFKGIKADIRKSQFADMGEK